MQYVHTMEHYMAQNQHTIAACRQMDVKNNVEKMKTQELIYYMIPAQKMQNLTNHSD